MALSADQAINILRRTTDAGWLEGLLADPDSAAVIQSWAAIVVRLSQSIDRNGAQGLISQASGGTPGVSIIKVLCPAVLIQPTLPEGTTFRDGRGATYVLRQPVGLTVNLVLDVPVETLRNTELLNTSDPIQPRFFPSVLVAEATNSTPIVVETTNPQPFADGSWVRVSGIEGNTAANGVWAINVLDDTHFELLTTVGNGTYTGGGVVQAAPGKLQIVEASNTDGASSDYLSLLGQERGSKRQQGELTEAYRRRVRNTPDVVSPKAIAQAIRGVAAPHDPTILEPFEDGSTPALDIELGLGTYSGLYWGAGNNAPAATGPYGWDDYQATLLNNRVAAAFFRILYPLVGDPDSLRFFWDASFFDDPIFGFLDVWDHPVQLARWAAIFDEAETKRAAAVGYDLTVNEETILNAVGDLAGGSAGGDYLLTDQIAPTGKLWWVRRIVYGLVTTAPGLQVPETFSADVIITYEDGSVVATSLLTPGQLAYGEGAFVPSSFVRGKRISRVQGHVYYDGVPVSPLLVRIVVELAVVTSSI